jgi:c-di-GMP-binding flagellar brake protein YcgR
MTPETTEEEAAAELASVADAFNNAKNISMEFDSHKYHAEVTEMSIGKYIVLKVANVDQGLIDVPRDYGRFKVRVFTIQGKVLIFPMKIIQRKLPFMVMAFPEKPEPEFSRSGKRLFVKQTVLIVLRKKDNPITGATLKGMGILTDLSPGGCSITSKMGLSLKDRVLVYVNISETKEPVGLELMAVVRRATEGGDGFGEYGLEWFEITEESRDKISKFLENHPSAVVSTK